MEDIIGNQFVPCNVAEEPATKVNMKTINIAPYIKELMIFDDPEYCAIFAGDATQICGKFFRHTCFIFEEEIVEDEKAPVKCPQCKEAYQKSLGKDHTGCTLDLGPNDIPQECVLDLPGHSEHDCVYSEEGMTKKDCGYWKTVNIKH